MSSGAPARWQRRDLPWRATLRGVVVAGPHQVLELVGPAAILWRVLAEPSSHADVVAAFERAGVLDALEGRDPLGTLRSHDLVRDVP